MASIALRASESKYLTLAEGAALLRFDSAKFPEKAFWQWLRRKAVPVRKVGRRVLVERVILEALIVPE